MTLQHQMMFTSPTREEVWLRAWCARISAAARGPTSATQAADACLAAFDERFAPARVGQWPPLPVDDEAT